MPASDLATLAQVKAWLPSAPASADDTLLGSLITAATTTILSKIQRGPVSLSVKATEYYDGLGPSETRKLLRRWPVTSITSLYVGSSLISPLPPQTVGPPTGSGYVIEQWDGSLPGKLQSLDLVNWFFERGRQNVQIIYTAGYLVSGELQTIPATGPFTLTALQMNGPFAQDQGVSFVGGAALTPVSGTPSTGQYNAGTPANGGVYTFAAADEGKPISMNYSFVPAPLNQACLEMAGEAYRYRTRIGERSHTIPGPQTVAYDLSRLTKAQEMMLQPFINVVPLLY